MCTGTVAGSNKNINARVITKLTVVNKKVYHLYCKIPPPNGILYNNTK